MAIPRIIESLPSFTKKELDKAYQLLEEHGQYDAVNNNRCFDVAIGATYNDNFSKISIKRSYLKSTLFKDADFTRAAATGSKFIECVFDNCTLENANFQFCDFTGSKFVSNNAERKVLGCNFSESNFSKVSLSEIELLGSSFSNVLFRDASIKNCNILFSTFENTLFVRTSFENLALRNLNMDYSEFNDVKMQNVILPFAQIPYIFGGLKHLLSTKDSVSVSSNINKSGIISIEEYFEVLNQLEIYYLSINEFFPLANIYLAKEEYNLCYQSILNGLFTSIQFKDFRQLKFFCKLASRDNVFSTKERSELFEKIEGWMPVSTFDQAELHDYEMHIGEIRSLLLSEDFNQLSVLFTIKTKIQTNEGGKIGELIDVVTTYVNNIDDSVRLGYIQIRHNSPYEILLQILSSDFAVVSSVVGGIYMLLMKSNKLVQEFSDTINKLYDIKIKKHTIKQNERLSQTGIEIEEVSHHISGTENMDTSSINKTIIHYHIKE